MKKIAAWHSYFIFIIVFFLLNILNTYVLTVQELNRYIAPFRHNFLGEMNAFLGNFSILFLVNTVFFTLIKKAKSRMQFLLTFTFILNFFIFWMGVFNLFFGTAFSIPASTIFKNPAEGFAMGTFIQAILELITYYRIIVFLPFIVLLTLYLLSDRVALKELHFKVTIKKALSAILIVSLTLYTAIFSYYEQFKNTLPLNAVKSTFAIQHLGVYPYYVGEFIGQPFDLDLQAFLELEDPNDLYDAYQVYNKNQDAYINFFNQETYHNTLNVDQTIEELFIDPSLQNGESLHGILEGKNLVLVHLESVNTFLLELDITHDRFVFLNRLLDESFYFSNFYNNVGMGVSSDAELSVLTGLYPMGDRTLYWEFNDIPYDLESIPRYFNEENYHTLAIHGDKKDFYNRAKVYPDLMKFDDFYALEDFIQDGYVVEDGYTYDHENNLVHHSPWISDYHLADETYRFGQTFLTNNTPFMMFSVMMMPHTPFEFDPNPLDRDRFDLFSRPLQTITMRYLNYVDYMDDVFKRFFVAEDGTSQTLDDTVYIFYSDHGSGIKNQDLDLLFNRELSVIETRKILQKVPAWIYVPGDETIDYGDYELRQGLLKGEQTLVRSQVDLYRTIIELFNLPVQDDPYFGVHGLSDEPTFALDNRLMDVVLDNYMYSMRNKRITYPYGYMIPKRAYDYILRFKQLSDILITHDDNQRYIYDVIRSKS